MICTKGRLNGEIERQENITGRWLSQKRHQRSDCQVNRSVLRPEAIWPRKVPCVLEDSLNR